jgi:glutamate-ammonia-ligase adenylyltransferase
LPKHQPGGLVDIEFIVQFGVLANAPRHPEVVASTSTLELLHCLADIGWLAAADARVLEQTAQALQQRRMLETLVPGESLQRIDSTAAAAVFDHVFGTAPRTGC